MSKYRINILTISGAKLIFHVDEYSIQEGNFVVFEDKKTGSTKCFHASRCEIERSSNG